MLDSLIGYPQPDASPSHLRPVVSLRTPLNSSITKQVVTRAAAPGADTGWGESMKIASAAVVGR